MAVPKHKVAKCRSKMRKEIGYYNLEAPAVSICPNCGVKKEPHRVCYNCGYYKGKLIVAKAIKEE